MNNPILTLLADAQARLERVDRKIFEAQRERELLYAQVQAFKEAARAVDVASGAEESQADAAVLQPARIRSAARPGVPGGWDSVFQVLYNRCRSGFGYDEIAKVADELEITYQRPSLRTKMMNYVNSGVVQRIDNGRFTITEQGLPFFRIGSSPNENGEAKASPDTGEVGASSAEKTSDFNRLFS